MFYHQQRSIKNVFYRFILYAFTVVYDDRRTIVFVSYNHGNKLSGQL